MADTVIVETSLGTFRIELASAEAPKTVENFLGYVDAGHYDGTIFHRVIDGFMVQGGGFTDGYEKKPVSAPVQNEAERDNPRLWPSVVVRVTEGHNRGSCCISPFSSR